MSVSLRATIEDFLSYRRLAMVGVSRNPGDFSRALFRELESRGYEMVPVNPGADEIDGKRCFHRLADIQPAVDGAFVMAPSSAAESIVQDCAAAAVPRIWFYRSIGEGSASQEALKFCEEHHIAVIPGECPFMFLAGGSWVHGVHRFCRKLMGTFPA